MKQTEQLNMAAPKRADAVMMAMIMLLLNLSVCFANRAMSDKNQQAANKPEALNGAAGATWSWGNNGGAGAAGIGFNIGGGSSSSGTAAAAPGSGAGSGSSSGGGAGSCPGQGGGCQGSVVGIPSFVIPGLVPIPMWGLYCTPIESCPAGNCGGIRSMFDYSQYAAHSINSTTNTNTTTTANADQETKTQLPNDQQGSRSDDHDLNLIGNNINGGSLPKDEKKREFNHRHDQIVDALAP